MRGSGQIAPESKVQFGDHLSGHRSWPGFANGSLDLLAWSLVCIHTGAVAGRPLSDGEQSVRVGCPVRQSSGCVGYDRCVVGVAQRDFQVRQVVQERCRHSSVPFVQIERQAPVYVAGRCQVDGEAWARQQVGRHSSCAEYSAADSRQPTASLRVRVTTARCASVFQFVLGNQQLRCWASTPWTLR